VRLIVGYSPGGLPDTVARVVAQRRAVKMPGTKAE